MTINTSDLRSSEFAGAVYVTLCGNDNSMPERQLLLSDGTSPNFPKGCRMSFNYLLPYLGYLTTCGLRVEAEEGSEISWNVDSVVVEVPTAGEWLLRQAA